MRTSVLTIINLELGQPHIVHDQGQHGQSGQRNVTTPLRLQACEALGRITSWAKDAIALNNPAMGTGVKRLAARCTELQTYIDNNKDALIDYGQRHRAGKPISTSRAESTVNQLVSARMSKRKQMRWSPRGAHRVQVRAAVLDGRFGHPAIQPAA